MKLWRHAETGTTRLTILVLTLLVVISSVLTAADSNWPQWRGPDGQGVSQEKGVPTEWTETANVQWKTAISGRGHSSPIVWENRVFLTTDIEGDAVPGAKAVPHVMGGKSFVHPDSVSGDRRHVLKVVSLDATTGRILWEQTAYDGTVYDDRHRRNTYASPTPVTDGRYVFAFFGTEGLYCYDFNGNLIWKIYPGKIRTLGLGAAASPLLFRDLVIVQCDEDSGEQSFMAAYDKKTGREVWKAPRSVQVSWSTPVLVSVNGRQELVANGSELVVGYDPLTGKELWRSKGVESNAIHTPVVGHGLVFVTAGFPAKRTLALLPGGSGDISTTPNVVWRYHKGTAYVPSALVYQDYLYLMSDKGVLTCLDAKTGEVKYEGGRVPVPATFTASPIAVEGKILLTSEDGDTFVVKAGPVHEILHTSSVGEPVYASPAIANRRVFVRGEKHLFAIGVDRTRPK